MTIIITAFVMTAVLSATAILELNAEQRHQELSKKRKNRLAHFSK